MSEMNPQIDLYFKQGCMRCPLGATPECKTLLWTEEMTELRRILLDSPLTEELKWSIPCYTFEGKNILLMSAFKEYCALSFFKGVLLKDTAGILVKQGENSQAARLIEFTDVKDVLALEPVLKAYIEEAIEVEKAGLKVPYKEVSEYPLPEELEAKFEEDPTLKAAFEALTPGRQRGYLLHFAAPKQAKTKVARIERCVPKILSGKGLNEW